MSLRVIHLAAQIENADDFHVARLLLLLDAATGRSDKPVKGIMKLAKMDFLLRYPNCLARALTALNKSNAIKDIIESESNTIEARMIRFRYGPWDKRYRRWISLLVSKNLAYSYLEGRTVNVKLTERGKEIANLLSQAEDFSSLAIRSKLVVSAVGGFSATSLKDFIYKVFPEIVDMEWGRSIEL